MTNILILINIILTSLLLYKSRKIEIDNVLSHPPKSLLKAWTKGKKKPKINDDSKAWMVENHLEKNS